MANWSNPLLTSTYTNFLTEVKDRDTDLALQFDGTTSTNIPTNTIRWNSSINRWQKWSGSAWGELTATYALTALTTTTTVTATGNVSGAALVPSSATIPAAGVFLPAANTLAFATATTERLRIDSSGRLLVGTPTNTTLGADFKVQVEAADATAGYSALRNGGTVAAAGPNFRFGRSRGAALGSVTAVQDGDSLGFLVWHGANGTDFSNIAAQISCEVDGAPFTAGDTTDLPGRLVFSTTADGAATPTERMRIDSFGLISIAGPGIKFPPTQVAAADPNTLDDYEEGTFTPTVIGGTTSGTGTYTVQTGKYVKVGGKVYVEVAMTWTAHTGTGAMQFAGLPFTAASTGNAPGVSFGRVSNIALTASNLLLGFVAANTTTIPLRQYAVGGGAEASVPIDTAGEVNFSATYMVV